MESVDDYQFVERLLPPTSILKPPKYEHYPTPSGWQPPRGELGNGNGLKAGGKHPFFEVGLNSSVGSGLELRSLRIASVSFK